MKVTYEIIFSIKANMSKIIVIMSKYVINVKTLQILNKRTIYTYGETQVVADICLPNLFFEIFDYLNVKYELKCNLLSGIRLYIQNLKWIL